MSAQNRHKLKTVLDAVPPGYLVTAAWLSDQGIGYGSFRDYVKRGWLERVARGVFRRPTPSDTMPEVVDWQDAILSLQHVMKENVHVGAMTALRMQGHSHYVELGEDPIVWLYGDRIPAWLSRISLNARLRTRTLSLFTAADPGTSESVASSSLNASERTMRQWTIKTSSAERAILEAIDELPENEAFETIDRVFEGLVNLRPGVMSELLRRCRSVKTKRLFFVFADRHGHAWRKHVDPDHVDLGRGDRALVPGGSIHPLYRIVVPSEYARNQAED